MVGKRVVAVGLIVIGWGLTAARCGASPHFASGRTGGVAALKRPVVREVAAQTHPYADTQRGGRAVKSRAVKPMAFAPITPVRP